MRVSEEAPESASERLFVIGGTAVAIAGMFKRSTTGGVGMMLLGGALVARGLQIRQANVDAAHGCVKARLPEEHGVIVEESIVVRRPAAQVYGFWRNLDNLPRFMSHLVSVREQGEGKSSWVVKGPSESTLIWEAEILEDRPNEVIAWRSLPGATVRNEGAVYFHSLPGDQTEVRVYLEYHPPLGVVGEKLAQLMGDDPQNQIREDLEHFKHILSEPVVQA